MKIAVCIKQVPVVSMLRFDSETRRVAREGAPSEVNPYDVLGLSLAMRLKGESGAEVVALTMGPPQAEDALRQALALGADRAVHLNDRAFAGSDTLATALALALALRRESPDLIVFGRNSVDAETGQVGPEVAEILGIPQITAVTRLELDASAALVRATRLTDEGFEDVECPLPAAVAVTDGAGEEVYPRRERMQEAAQIPIETLAASDLSDDPNQFGLAGSPTWVDEIFTLESSRAGTIVRDAPPDEAVSRLMAFLEERGAFGDDDASDAPAVPRGARMERGDRGGFLVLAEIMGGAVRSATLELLGRARDLAEPLGIGVEALLIGEDDDAYIRELAAYGADTVRVASDPALRGFDTESHAAALAAAIELLAPFAVLVPSTTNGRDIAARVAARLGLGLTGDCVGLDVDDEGRLSQLKPAFGGGIVAPIMSNTLPNMATVRPGILSARAPDWSIEPRVERVDAGEVARSKVRVVRSVVNEAGEGAELEGAERIVGVGKGIGGPDNLPPIRDLADALGASLGTTRDVADLGWLPRQLQIGLSGKAVSPRLYVAVALRGPFNHTVGIQRANTIVAINNSARSPIFRAADFGILGNWEELVPPLAAAFRERLG